VKLPGFFAKKAGNFFQEQLKHHRERMGRVTRSVVINITLNSNGI
jgi:hypothetical protein